jgi:hypothetical protein
MHLNSHSVGRRREEHPALNTSSKSSSGSSGSSRKISLKTRDGTSSGGGIGGGRGEAETGGKAKGHDHTAAAAVAAAVKDTGFNATEWDKWLQWLSDNKNEDTFYKLLLSSSSIPSRAQKEEEKEEGVTERTRASLFEKHAHHWWKHSVATSAKAKPPTAGKSTLVFIHVPKTVTTHVIDLNVILLVLENVTTNLACF